MVRLEVDWRNKIVDIFVSRDRTCPYPFLIASPKSQEIEEAHEGLSFAAFKALVMMVNRTWATITEEVGNI